MDAHDNFSNLGDRVNSHHLVGDGYSSISKTSINRQDGLGAEEICKTNHLHNSMDSCLNKEYQTQSSITMHDNSGDLIEVSHERSRVKDDRPFGASEESVAVSKAVDSDSDSLWLPPEPEDLKDEEELSVGDNDDDDDTYGFGQISSSSDLSDKKKRRTAMMEAMHAQFKSLVSRFLASEGITSEGGDGDGWVEIVAGLSWNAAKLVKPDATEGRAMDPGFYVKVKCIACGSRSESQVIKGLVFKKNAAHKHMPTNFKNAKLLLIKGILGEHISGLSSFNSMEQEKDYVKSVIDIIETCHPNVVLVEKTASRDAQESLLAKGITLVFDMKLSRLERIARCTGSQIIDSADIAMNVELKKCDSFHIERFVEEHNSANDGGKRSSKTLMFFVGCPRPLGCTILLKGAHSDELKKVKRVLQYTVFAAYHLILETSFFADQMAVSFYMNNMERQIGEREKYTTIPGSGGLNMEVPSHESYVEIPIEIISSNESSEDSGPEGFLVDISAANRMLTVASHSNNISYGDFQTPRDMQDDVVHRVGVLRSGSSLDYSALPGQFPSYPPNSQSDVQTGSSGWEFKDTEHYNDASVASGESRYLETIYYKKETKTGYDNETKENGTCRDLHVTCVSDFSESTNHVADAHRTADTLKDNTTVMSDTQSILILFSSRSTSKETVCEQNHLSRIKYYGNFDMSLGRFLQDILLNQKHCCPCCGESSEAHVYSYTHQNGKLTVKVKPVHPGLPGEKSGKLWMWTRCLKCQDESKIPQPTKRVIMSTAARGLSFGKFLELSFSSHSAAKMLSQCGHLLHRDCFRFFGFGSKVAMFSYSPVEFYTACQPPPVIEFNSPIRHEWFEKEVNDVKKKGEVFFTEIASLLQDMTLKTFPGSVKSFTEVEEMLNMEREEFEESLLTAMKCHGHLGKYTPEIVNLAYISQDLLLGLYVWERRFCSLQMSTETSSDYDGTPGNDFSGKAILLSKSNSRREIGSGSDAKDAPIETIETDIDIARNPLSSNSKNGGEFEPETCAESLKVMRNEMPPVDGIIARSQEADELDNACSNCSISVAIDDGRVDVSSSTLDGSDLQMDSDTQGEIPNKSFVIKLEGVRCNGDGSLNEEDSLSDDHAVSLPSKTSGPEDWIWLPFPEMHMVFFKESHRDYLKRFEVFRSHNFEHLTSLYKKLAPQDREHAIFPLGSEGIIITLHEEEISSIIACALTKCDDHPVEFDMGISESGTESMPVVTSDASLMSLWSSKELSNLDWSQSHQSHVSLSSDEGVSDSASGNSSSSRSLHRKVEISVDKATAKSKYSVVCIYADNFRNLRRYCCSSELDYISSLSRCRKWDAQGGKSGALFAKTLDDRFIIKEIKRTELDSFLKFGREYFNHVLHSLATKSQTCLAKIVGIYQVKQIKGGRETRYDLMVMENVLYGRDVIRTYDLKGAVHARYISNEDNPEKVFLDQNFVEDMGLSPMYIGNRTKQLLARAVWNDTSFLTSINVMDYSLLVGVDKTRNELIFGIIDYLRQYTWDKQLETWVKTSLIVRGNSRPTVISPKDYKMRFRKFMSKYFLTVPDIWVSNSCPDPCKSCSDNSADAS